MKCHECNSNMKESKELYHYIESGLDNVWLGDVSVYRCECGEYFASIPAIIELNLVIALYLIKKKTFLKGREIKYLRKNAGLNAKAFAEYIGIDKSTLSRWENNKQIIDKSNDRMIRLFYATFKGVSPDKMKSFFDDVMKEIDNNGEETRINIPITDILSEQQAECRVC
ncbi:MAG: helix-turn-helix domain-containing protein [Deltaproteobacteria bacterium]|nr:helix-turn-helix domain-containing protein [Deltaproteobacteria bacterium]